MGWGWRVGRSKHPYRLDGATAPCRGDLYFGDNRVQNVAFTKPKVLPWANR